MYLYIVCTLFDITRTNVLVYRNGIDSLHSRNQQRNWQTVSQLIQYRTQPLLVTEPIRVSVDLSAYNFGVCYQGVHNVWHSVFVVSQQDLYTAGQDELFYLKNNFDQVPIITGLDETVALTNTVINTQDSANICFYTENQWNNQIDIDFQYLKNCIEAK